MRLAFVLQVSNWVLRTIIAGRYFDVDLDPENQNLNKAKARLKEKKKAKLQTGKAEANAATKVQSMMRGNAARKEFKSKGGDLLVANAKGGQQQDQFSGEAIAAGISGAALRLEARRWLRPS